MKFPSLLASISLLGLMSSGVPAMASSVYTANLASLNEVPPVMSAGSGAITVTVNNDALSLMLNFTGLTSDAVAGHIHCCGPVGMNEPVALPFTTIPTGVTSGTYNATFDLTNSAVYTSQFLTSSGGTAQAAEGTLISGLNSNQAYANVHTTNFPGGEIEGQLAATPEPATLLLTGCALAGVLFWRRKTA